ncbi:TolC family protein [Pontivivens ytuae]|uniref:TolC family protein n=1 Tax=Pontivivens ytuae TaxID=2789856 RepID=A0A7S9LSH0_9RHOB|nr:TolC family protein [Pontivivens ytuae]QPH54145.1 TolC family protein [Pontivivens ytuae]
MTERLRQMALPVAVGVLTLLSACGGGGERSLLPREGVRVVEAPVREGRPMPAAIAASDYSDSDFARTIRQATLDFPAVDGQRARSAGVEARGRALRSGFRPQLTGGVTAGTSVLGDSSGEDTQLFVTARQLVFDGAATRNRISLNEVEELQVDAQTELLLSALALRAVRATLDLWLQSELLELARRDAAAHQLFVAQTSERMEQGVATTSDVMVARSRLADARVRLAQAETGRATAEASYASIIGPPPAEIALPPEPPLLETATARARVGSGRQLALARLRITAAQAELEVVRAQRFPAVFVELTGRRGDVLSSDGDEDVFLGLSVDQNIFTAGRIGALEAEAASEVAAARSTLGETRREVTRALDIALANRDAFPTRLAAAVSATAANEAGLAAAQELFAIGQRSFTDILDAQRDLTQAATREATLRADGQAAAFEVLDLTGDLLDVIGLEGRLDPVTDVLGPPPEDAV